MSLDAVAIVALANDLKAAKIACGAADNPALAALCLAEANAISTFVKKGSVEPLAAPDPDAMKAGATPVTGKAKIT